MDADGSAARLRRDRFWGFFWFVAALVLTILPMQVQQGVSSVLRATVLAPFLWTQESLQRARLRTEEVDDLRAQLDEAMARLVGLAGLRLENEELRATLGLQARLPFPYVGASAVRPGTRGSDSLLLLDVGAQHGVSVGDPVISADGLLGVIREVGPVNSLALDWTHPDFAVSVITETSGVGGIVEAWRGSFREEDRLFLKGIAYNEPLSAGDLLVTSGLGAYFPRGIPVGWVDSEAGSEAGWQRSFWVRPVVPVERVTHVLVLRGSIRLEDVDLTPAWSGAEWDFPDAPEADTLTDSNALVDTEGSE
jgi:rod shape-determining protein MreC